MRERGPLRFSPAGVPVLEFGFAHQSERDEAGSTRKVQCELMCVAVGETARMLQMVDLTMAMRLQGFLADCSARRKIPRLHVTQFECLQDNNPIC